MNSSTTALSVNLNKVALLRNTRQLGIPSLVRAANQCLDAGAQGITVHPRPDGRHIRADDVAVLRRLVASRPGIEFNIEGNPFHNLMDFVREHRPEQCTFVPDSEAQFTSDHGWEFPAHSARLAPVIAQARALGVRVSLFMDPRPELMEQARALGAERVELYTGTYAQAWGTRALADVLDAFKATAAAAQACGLAVNAGHDLNLDNLSTFLREVPSVSEVSIGHALIADALEQGYSATIKAYRAAIDNAYAPQPR